MHKPFYFNWVDITFSMLVHSVPTEKPYNTQYAHYSGVPSTAPAVHRISLVANPWAHPTPHETFGFIGQSCLNTHISISRYISFLPLRMSELNLLPQSHSLNIMYYTIYFPKTWAQQC